MKYEINKRWISLFAVIAMLGLMPVAHATASSDSVSAKEVQREAKDLIQALKNYTASQKDEAVRKTGAALDNLDRRVDALETRIDKNWDKMNKATRDKARTTLRALRKQRTEVAEWYGSLKSSSSDAWGQMKKGFTEAYASLHEAWNKAEKEFADK